MITVTEEAKALMGTQETPEGTVLRLDPVPRETVPPGEQATEGAALGLVAGEPRGDDQVVEHGGEEVLRIAAPVSERLDGSTVDVMVEEGVSPDGSDDRIVGIGIRPPAPDAPQTDDS